MSAKVVNDDERVPGDGTKGSGVTLRRLKGCHEGGVAKMSDGAGMITMELRGLERGQRYLVSDICEVRRSISDEAKELDISRNNNSLIINVNNDRKLTEEARGVEIMDREVKQLKRSHIPIVKV
ncbi:hypothetical protein Tco_0104070 [Tanacetum coccineum]